MCFSATASFALGSVLIPMGGWCVQKAWKGEADRVEPADRPFLPLAVFPLAFGLQQAIEGVVWLGMGGQNPALMHSAALGFVFFSHGFWLFWVPFMVSVLEDRPRVRWIWRGMAGVGFWLGAYFWVPLLLHADWLTVSVQGRSLHYSLQILIAHPLLMQLGRMLYGSTILVPLLLTKHPIVQRLGWLVLASLLLTSQLFREGLISVWCYFAAVASVYVGYQFFQGVETPMESPPIQGS